MHAWQDLVYGRKFDHGIRQAAKLGGTPEQVFEQEPVKEAWQAIVREIAKELEERNALQRKAEEEPEQEEEELATVGKAPTSFPLHSASYWRAVANQTVRTYITLVPEPKTLEGVVTAIEQSSLKSIAGTPGSDSVLVFLDMDSLGESQGPGAQAIAPEVHGGPPTSAKTHSRGDARSWKSETWKFGSDSGRWRRLSHDSWRTGAPWRGERGEEHVSPLKCEKGSRSWLRSERSFDCFRWRKHQTEKAKSQRRLYIPHHSAGGQRRAFGAKRTREGLRAPSGAHYIKYRPRCQGSGAGWHVVCKQDWQLPCPIVLNPMLNNSKSAKPQTRALARSLNPRSLNPKPARSRAR